MKILLDYADTEIMEYTISDRFLLSHSSILILVITPGFTSSRSRVYLSLHCTSALPYQT